MEDNYHMSLNVNKLQKSLIFAFCLSYLLSFIHSEDGIHFEMVALIDFTTSEWQFIYIKWAKSLVFCSLSWLLDRYRL